MADSQVEAVADSGYIQQTHSMPEDNPNQNEPPSVEGSKPRWGPQHAGAKELASLNSSGRRLQQMLSVGMCFPLLAAAFGFLCYHFQRDNCVSIIWSSVAGILAGDFLVGLVHWGADTWGSIDSVVGKNVLRSFRQHHIDPIALTRNDFIKTNGDNCLSAIPFFAYQVYKFLTLTPREIHATYTWHCFIFFVGVVGMMSQQCHIWAHMYSGRPWWVTLLQDCHIILPRRHHSYHHANGNVSYYCAATGWANYPLEMVNFWRRLEEFITAVTGVKPRTDNMMWAKNNTL